MAQHGKLGDQKVAYMLVVLVYENGCHVKTLIDVGKRSGRVPV